MEKSKPKNYFFVYRKLFVHEIGKNPLAVALWIRLLSEASYEDKEIFWNGKALKIKRGQLITSILQLAQWLKISERQTKRYLLAFQKINTIAFQTTNKYTVITIKNYNLYQDAPVKAPDKRRTNAGQTPTTNTNNTNNTNNILPEQNVQAFVKEQKKYERLPTEKQSIYYRLCYFLEDMLHTNIVNYPKQFKAIQNMVKAGYTEQQICNVIRHMATKNDFYIGKGFDLMTVSNQIPLYKAKFRKETNGQAN